MTSPVQLADYRIKKIHFEISEEIEDFDPGAAAFSLDVDYEIYSLPEESSINKLALFVNMHPRREEEIYMPFEIELILEGFFVFEENIEEEEKSYHLNISCPTMLYGSARSIIHQMTGQTNYGSISIPSVQFAKVAEEKLEEND